MRKIFFVCLFLLGLIILLFGVFNKNAVSLESPQGQNLEVEKVQIVNDWFPKIETAPRQDTLQVGARSAILVDFDTGEVLFAKNPQERMPVASTVKIMTALVALEHKNLTDEFTVSNIAATIGEDTMGLAEGEVVSFDDLLYGLMLPSGNDAAVTIAEGVAGTEDAFVTLMNKKVLELGLDDTKFVNASGLDVDDEAQFSTPYDLATIAHFAWESQKALRRVAATDRKFIDATQKHKAFDLQNDTNLLTTYPGVRGIKPGFTWEAGYCLVTYAENDGKKLIGVVLNSENRRADMTAMLDFGFAKFGIKVEHPQLEF